MGISCMWWVNERENHFGFHLSLGGDRILWCKILGVFLGKQYEKISKEKECVCIHGEKRKRKRAGMKLENCTIDKKKLCEK